MSDIEIIEQDKFTDKELADFTHLFNATIQNVCLFADKHNFERDNIMKYFSERLVYFAELSTIKNYKWGQN